MSLFPSTLTGRVLDDGQTPPPVIELQGISAGQLSLVLTQYTPLETTTQNTADIGTNAAAIAALQGQVAALPAAPDLTPYALAADLAAAEGSILANASGLVAVNTSLTQGLATKANQSALDALQGEVNGKSTPASVDLKLANHPTTAAMNSSIASANNATLSSVAATYALKTVVDQLAIDLAARQTAADVDQRVATALLSYLTQTAYQAGQALQDARLDGHDTEILALQSAGPFATAGDLSNLQVSVIEIEADCWSKAQSDSRYPLVATFNSLGSTVTSIDGRVTALENSPAMAPTADLTVNSLTATSFLQTPLLQSATADLQIRNATTTIRAEDGTLLASFAAGSIGLEQDITVRSDRTLNATTADFAQFFVGSTAATGAFTSSSSITCTQQIESDLRAQAPLLRCDPAASVLTVTGGTQGVLVDDTLRVNGVIAPEASLPFLSLSGGSGGVQVLSPLLEQIAVAPNSSVGLVARNAAGDASLILDSNAQNGLVELKALAGGGVQMNTLFQFMSFNTTNGLANLAIEPNIGGSNNGELIFGYGFVNLSDKALKTNVRELSEKELQETFDAVEPRMYDRIEGGKDQIGFIAQEVQTTPLGEKVCKTKNLDGRELMTLDYQKLNVVLGRGEVPAEASREAGKEEARPLLKWRSRRRSDSSSSWPGTSTCGTPASSSRSPEGSSRTGGT